MNVARSGHALVVVEQVILISILFSTFCLRLSLLWEVTQIQQNGWTLKLVCKNYLVKPCWYSCERILASVFHLLILIGILVGELSHQSFIKEIWQGIISL